METGELNVLPGARALEEKGVDLASLLVLHSEGEWGELTDDEILQNLHDLFYNGPVTSRYETKHGMIIVHTARDRKTTTVMALEDAWDKSI
jgi:hypothetical protein